MLPGVWTIYGPSGSSKSSQALLFPEVIDFYDLDRGAERSWGWREAVTEERVRHKIIDMPVRSMTRRYERLEGFSEAWKSFADSMGDSFEDSSCSTVVVDTASINWKLDSDGFLQQIQEEQKGGSPRKQLQQVEYGEPNRRQDMFYEAAHRQHKNLVMIHHEEDEYIIVRQPNGDPVFDESGQTKRTQSGNKIPEGFRHGWKRSDWVIYFDHIGDGQPSCIIKKSGYGFDLVGLEVKWKEIQEKGGIYKAIESKLRVLGRA
jgi:hypothetical protein